MVNIKTYTLAILVTVLLLMSAFSLNWYTGNLREAELKETYSSLSRSLSSSQLEFEYITNYGENNCELFDESIKLTRTNLISINNKLEKYKDYMISDQQFNNLKAEQTLLYIKMWMMSKQMKETCDMDLNTILYFWDLSTTSKQQGYILDSIGKNNQNTLIIPLDYNFDLGIIKLLKTDYEINSVPTILINENIKLEGLNNREGIEKYL
ncbi:MAG: hypothetical protein KJ906_00745 [Nanoarchaeota archaeon]|nr:hypothetical protein [Nanoarchaeota archaeon]